MNPARTLQLAARFARHRLADIHPFEVQAGLLNACNLKCAYCRCPEIKTELMTTEQWIDIIRRLGELGTMRIKFQGGEPTLRHDFRDLCAAARGAGIATAVVTNGLLVAAHPELLDHLDEIVFSLDAVQPELNDALRGAGVHAQVMQAIEVARRKPNLRIFVNMVVSRTNLDEVEPMLRFCEERGIGLNAQPVMTGKEQYDIEARAIALDAEQTRALFARLAAWKREGRGLMFAAATYEHAARWEDHSVLTVDSEGESSCAMGRDYVHIEPNGDVRQCIQADGGFTPKNIRRHGLEEALRHVRHHHCGTCFIPYLNERKALFGLRPHALMEFLRRS